MVASDFYKLDLRKNRKLAGLNGALGETDNNKQKKEPYLLLCYEFIGAVSPVIKLSL